jgi:hypothetical protein
MNISGLWVNKNNNKDDNLRQGISALEFEIFGLAETNTDWRVVEKDSRLYANTRGWWETTHISFAHNCTNPPRGKHQWGGMALLSINKAAHQVSDKGIDESSLGCWCWTHYRGRNNHILYLVCTYRPNFPTGPLSVYSQQRSTLLEREDERCPRMASFQDLGKFLNTALQQGEHIILLMDGNTSMKRSDLHGSFGTFGLKEAVLSRHGIAGPETFHRNKTRTPIDGIWVSQSLVIECSGYLDYDSVILGVDHCCLWIDLSFTAAFGHNMPSQDTKP